jgi:hypothetical protein
MRIAGQHFTTIGARAGDVGAANPVWCAPRNALVVTTFAAIVPMGVLLAPSAHADLTDDLASAVTQARAASCGPLASDPAVTQSAQIINKSYSDWADHTASYPPITDALPGLKELGFRGSKAKYIGGAGKTEADTIKGVLLEGYSAIPDCSYNVVGYNMVFNESAGKYLAAAVFAGP